MALKDLLYVPFNRAYTSQDIRHWFEYLSTQIDCEIRVPDWAPLYGKLQTKNATLEFRCAGMAQGYACGLAFQLTNCAKTRKAETELLKKIHRATKSYSRNGH